MEQLYLVMLAGMPPTSPHRKTLQKMLFRNRDRWARMQGWQPPSAAPCALHAMTPPPVPALPPELWACVLAQVLRGTWRSAALRAALRICGGAQRPNPIGEPSRKRMGFVVVADVSMQSLDHQVQAAFALLRQWLPLAVVAVAV